MFPRGLWWGLTPGSPHRDRRDHPKPLRPDWGLGLCLWGGEHLDPIRLLPRGPGEACREDGGSGSGWCTHTPPALSSLHQDPRWPPGCTPWANGSFPGPGSSFIIVMGFYLFIKRSPVWGGGVPCGGAAARLARSRAGKVLLSHLTFLLGWQER